ncbi:MAG TPA: ABC transporter permease [Vicinamibacterales bacterium]|nr:ABC transporter permease [Vicinamibacterales bacterium]
MLDSIRLWQVWTRLGIQDVRLKFRRSAIGPVWPFVNLAVMVLSIGFIYANLLGQEPREFIPYLTIGMILWTYLTNSIVDGGNAFIHAEGYIKQISLPIYVYILRAFISITLTMLITMGAFVIVAAIYRIPFAAATLLAIPGLVMVMATTLLLITIFAHLNARFRDVAHMATVGMQVLFYVTPVIFPAALLRHRRDLTLVIELNPMYHLLEVVRQPLLHGVAASWQSYAAVAAIIVVLTGAAAAVIAAFQRRIVFAL